ncbi:MAG: chromate efflux transporter [Caldilineaceae bacterium SB0668_bin_21]|nr:chromate efflux transporter [Caldilineaceae bacterium SB0668_bin_21]MYC19892.1 chromate efflux transporter [Caldilineaceae bacterium SB0662_bin_25]
MKLATGTVAEVVKLCGKLGIIGFGGPASHIAMLEDEAVARRKWLTREHFLDLVGATNLIPGPNSTEMMIHIGYQRAGWPGLIAAGISFVLPAVLLSTLIAWIYVEFGTLPAVQPFLAGVKPAVLAVILGALWRLGMTASKPREAAQTRIALAVIGIAVAVAVYLGVPVIWSLIAGGLLGMLALRAISGWNSGGGAAGLLVLPALPDSLSIFPWANQSPASALKWAALLLAATAPALTLGALGLFFLKVGAVLYGSGYVLVAFLEGDLVHEYGWLTQQQLLDAIAIGQFTPGPVLSTAAFIGYVLAGIPGAAISAAAIFAPSFVFVAILNPIVPRLRSSAWMGAFLDAVNVSAVGLMAAVLVRLTTDIVTAWPAAVIALLAAAAVLRWRVTSAWVVIGGALLGWPLTLLA